MIIRLLFSLLLLTCIFDPADLIFGLKVPIFVLLIGYSIVTRRFSFKSKRLLGYVMLFSLVLPIISFLIGYLTNMDNYDDPNIFSFIKPYLFLFIAFAFQDDVKLQIDIIKILAYELLLLSIVSLVILLISVLEIVPFDVLYEFGFNNVLYGLGERTYGPIKINRIYFHTAPMLVFALCFFIDHFYRYRRKYSLFLSFVVSAALLFSGTRNDMIMGILPYFVIAYIYGSRITRFRVIAVAFLFVVYLMSQEIIASFFDTTERSNSMKIGFLDDYVRAFSSIRTLVIGDGLGSFFEVSGRGRECVTELTYLELLRRFGVFGASIYLYLMVRPARGLIKRRSQLWIGLAYSFYLFMIIFNPFFFSSNGMIILSIVIVLFYNSTKDPQKFNQLFYL